MMNADKKLTRLLKLLTMYDPNCEFYASKLASNKADQPHTTIRDVPDDVWVKPPENEYECVREVMRLTEIFEWTEFMNTRFLENYTIQKIKCAKRAKIDEFDP
jgi:hypothetical protein